ncbi:MAG: hypothetical protein EAZ32_09970 [Cytophagia bacterium]|nr:MAG: hypothetical protein EAZ46_05550 [Runella sp.]TAG20275.1 MAG: hypothetical protein EAZ38_10700 [Cytophagales bacterium]TAG39402.1 MAG: hypothetical protein EAZ32_09970 [Cytophagia bacterium]TAG80846.1 MAG: hypothetical protein EAZ22_08545 [Cytophagales bacterium]
MKTIITAMLYVSVLSHAFAQNLPDTFTYTDRSRYIFELEQGNKLIARATDLAGLQKFQNIDSTLALFLKDYKMIKSNFSESVNGKTVVYRKLKNGQFQLNFTEHQSKGQRFQFSPNNAEPLLIKTVQDTLLIVHSYQKPFRVKDEERLIEEEVYFCFILNNIDDVETLLKNGTANAHIQMAMKDVKNYPHHNLQKTGYRFDMNYKQNSGTPTFKAVESFKSPFLAFHQTFGVGVFRNQLVPNSQTELAFIPSKYHNVGYTLGWRSMFFTERNDQTNNWRTLSNGVLQVGFTFYDFKRNQPRRVDAGHVLFGAYLGRVMTRNGGIFEPNTWNLSMTVAARGIVKVQPEVYFNGFFKNAMPGIRVQMGF